VDSTTQEKGHIKKGVELPKRNPDYKLVGKTYPNQAFIYRLPYDLNPLHIDPDIAATQKFERPIPSRYRFYNLGLASYGTVARVVVQ
jgi:peroxisomal enoyl-CoA hydratase 2